jgi:myo-inositol catabolism protein IolS
MEYRKIGRTGLNGSILGFGCWAIGGHGYGKVDDNISIHAIQRALDLGINLFDTADVYGFGHSEEILGKALGSRKKDAIIATKFGVGWDKSGQTFRDCSPKRVRKALEASLRRLAVDCISLYQVHWYDGTTPISSLMEELEKCRQEGKIRYVGCSNFSIEPIKTANMEGVGSCFETIQTSYNLLERNSEKLIQECAELLGMGVLAYGLLARGLFSGKYDTETKFGDFDTRVHDVNFSADGFRRNMQLLNVLKETAIRYGKTTSQVAIRWVLENKNITTALIGIKDACQVEENAGAIGWKLDPADYKAITLTADMVFGNSEINTNTQSR